MIFDVQSVPRLVGLHVQFIWGTIFCVLHLALMHMSKYLLVA